MTGGLRLHPEADGGLGRIVADQLGDRVGLRGLLADVRADDPQGRRARWLPPPGGSAGSTAADPHATGFGWDVADQRDEQWWPQGLTISADAGPVDAVGRVLLAGWYAKQDGRSDQASRVTVVDLDAGPDGPRYAHVALVEPYREQWSGAVRHRAVRVHAGGLVWLGQWLLVADTRHGVRVFDLTGLIRLGPGVPSDHGVRHLLPQSASWSGTGAGDATPLRWSFLSLDRTEPGRLSLVAGEYDRGGRGARVARWTLDPDSGLPAPELAVEVLRTDIASMQGAVRVRGRYLISASRGRRRRGQLWTGPPGGPYARHPDALPVGPEDLAYDPGTDRLWTQTEYPGARTVVSVSIPPG